MPPADNLTELPRLHSVSDPAPDADRDPSGTDGGDRYRPTRAGVINIWRYYDETFHFHVGRLLLRGPNGTGKSKALELLLPFLFDANLQPSRLSTFGGTERTMHWNLMGDGYDRTNRVGYVWLEFGRGSAWFTCGARLQASTNTRTVSVTYFTTSERVGMDGGIELINAAGRPLTKQDLAEAIGEYGEVYDTAAEYRRVVRETLFGFSSQRYNALITALLQLRTPKLSEHLDPAVLSTLLSRALPPLDEGDIAEIAEGFERLDRQQQELEGLDVEVSAAETLAARQRTYAQRVLRAGAATLISATSHMDGLTRKARESQTEYENTSHRLAEVAEKDATLEAEHEQRSTRIDTLTNLDAYREGRELDRLRTDRGAARQRADQGRHHADALAGRADRDREEAEKAEERATRDNRHADQCRREAERAAWSPGMTATFEELDCTDDAALARRLLDGAANTRQQQIREVRNALQAHATAVGQQTAAEQRLEDARAALDAAETTATRAQQAYDEELDNLAGRLDRWACECVELDIDADALVEVAGAQTGVVELVNSVHGKVANAITRAETSERVRQDELARQRERLKAERDELDRQTDIPPPAPHTRHLDRSTIAGAPLWRLVAFRSGVDAGVQAGVEASLEASGLLDAWVFPDGRMSIPDNDVFAEPDRTTPASGRSLAEVLVCEPGAPVPEQRVTRLLEHIAYGESAPDHVAAVGADGSWRLAATQGRWVKPEPAYIGATARERARQRKIAELDGQIADVDRQITAVDEVLAELSRRRDVLAAELARRPGHEAVEQARQAQRQAEAERAARGDAVSREERSVAEWEREVSATLQALTAKSSERGLPAGEDALDRLADALTAFQSQAGAWLAARQEAVATRQSADRLAGAADRARADAQEAEEAAAAREREAEQLAERVDAIESSVGAEYRQLIEEISGLRARLTEIDTERKRLRTTDQELRTRLGTLETERNNAAEHRDQAVVERDAAAARFRHLWAGWLPGDARLEVDAGALESTTAALDTARRVAALLPSIQHEVKDVRSAEARVSDQLRDTEEALAGRADLSFDNDEDIRVLSASVDGRHMGIGEFTDLIRAERDQARTHLTEAERDLFDRTLTGDTRRHLASRIRQAQELVDTMNQHLGQVQTASRLRVHLQWQVDPKLPAGTREARDLLLHDPAGLSENERDALHRFFRERIDEARSDDTSANWERQLLDVLDYTKWHMFVVNLDRDDGNGWRPVTKRVHGALSGGEKAIILHLPLFAAVAAHYRSVPHAPRIILLDEVFVGVDAVNRGQLLELLAAFELDMMLTSDHEWCTYAELDGISIHQLVTDPDDDAVTTVRFTWNGRKMVAAEPMDGEARDGETASSAGVDGVTADGSHLVDSDGWT